MMKYNDIPVSRSQPETYQLTEHDKEYLKSFAVDGVMPIKSYIMAMNQIVNHTVPGVETW